MSSSWSLPLSWSWATFGDVASVDSNLVDPAEYGSMPHIAPNHIESGTGRLLDYSTVAADGVTSPKHLFSPGHIIYSKIRPYLAKAVLVDFEGLCSADTYPVSTNLDARFLHTWLVSPMFTESASRQQGRTVLPKINQTSLKKLLVPVPPANEQRRIATKIDALQARSRRAREALGAIPALLDRFRQSVLAAAFRGDLTAQWRAAHPEVEPASILLERIRAERKTRWIEAQAEKARARAEAQATKAGNPWTAKDDAAALKRERAKATTKYTAPEPVDPVKEGLPELPAGWCWVRLEMLAFFENGDRGKAYPQRSEYQESGVPFINTGHICQDGSLSQLTMNYISRGKFNTLRSGKIVSGDLVYCLRGALGKTAYTAPFSEGAIASSLVIIRPVAEWWRGLIYHFLVSPSGRAEIRKHDNGTAQPNLGARSVAKYLIPVPPRDEAGVLVDIIKSSEQRRIQVLSTADSCTTHIKNLSQSILAKAFRGELVPQDPDDEPASELLKRIQAERAAAEATKPKRGRKKKSSAKAPPVAQTKKKNAKKTTTPEKTASKKTASKKTASKKTASKKKAAKSTSASKKTPRER